MPRSTPSEVTGALQVGVSTCELVLANAERIHDLEDVLPGLNVQEHVSLAILSVREVEEVTGPQAPRTLLATVEMNTASRPGGR